MKSSMVKEFEINGCIAVPNEITEDKFYDIFINFVESQGWSFGGGIQEIQDGYYITKDGKKGKFVLNDL